VPSSRGCLRVLAASVVTAVVGLTPAAAGAAGTVVTPPASIASDCSVDVTASIQAVLTALPDNATLQFAPGACYRIDGTLLVKGRVGLTIDGRGVTFRQVTNGAELVNPSRVRARNVWTFQQNTNLTVRDMTVFGANPAAGRGDKAYQPKYEGQHAYTVLSGTNTLLDHVQAYDTYGDFVFVGPAVNGLVVRNSVFSRNGRQGWTINGSNITFDHNTISETRRATVDMEPSLPSWAAHNVTISNNEVGKGRGLFVANKGAPLAPIDNVSIVNNHLTRKSLQILVGGGAGYRNNYRVIGNTSDVHVSGFGSSMSFRNVVGLEVRDNVQPTQFAHPLFGVGLWHASHVVISGNRWEYANGVWIDRGGNVDVRQSGNWIGSGRVTLVAAPATYVPGPTIGTPR
jgi:hypothetical protein